MPLPGETDPDSVALSLLLFCAVLQAVQLERLAFYHDCGAIAWQVDTPWEKMPGSEWDKVSIKPHRDPCAPASGLILSTA